MRKFLQAPHRGVLLQAAAVVLGLAVAGFGLFRVAPQPLVAVPPGYVALVNQKGILFSDFMQQTQVESSRPFSESTSADRSRVLHEMINEELLVQRGVVLDVPETTNEVRSSIESAVNAQVAAPVLAYVPTDAELHAFYDQFRQNYTAPGSMTLHDLVLHVGGYQNADQSQTQAQADAAEAVYQLRAGAPLDHVMEHFGLVDSGRVDNTDQLDFAAKLHLGDPLYQVASKLRDGEISEPVVTDDGVHILVMVQHQFPKVAEFSAVRDRVYLDFRTAATGRATDENLKLLRSQAQILLAPGQSE